MNSWPAPAATRSSSPSKPRATASHTAPSQPALSQPAPSRSLGPPCHPAAHLATPAVQPTRLLPPLRTGATRSRAPPPDPGGPTTPTSPHFADPATTFLVFAGPVTAISPLLRQMSHRRVSKVTFRQSPA